MAIAASTVAADAGIVVASTAAAVSTNAEIARTIFHLVLVEGGMRPHADISHEVFSGARGH
ncbi:hypothetical protein SK571_20200 [Lentzea sp. BCCO 10_0798]|uniref:Uncharacterized protein n=1 Tax=Lentzea kristufekii TaxID=3095430 RepID=A0ABU4TUL0_9PSEU|nr:hypothetical protein [Lentzea sp. BCCO 10_0798]MDX8051719.1 hypothetical protein [Lentzea sp. BCCO 10_0798]